MAHDQGSGRVDIALAMRDMSTMVLSSVSFVDVLHQATDIAKATIPGADEVSVTMGNERPTTVASSGPVGREIDATQYASGDGPCLEAIRTDTAVLVGDLARENRWPDFTRHALLAGVYSSMSLPLRVGEDVIGAFNCFAKERAAFGEESLATGTELSAFAGVVLNNVGLYFTAESRADQLEQAMKSRAVIEQAKGILMGTRICTADEAFAILVDLSQHTHRKLRDVAAALVEQTMAPR